ncbi:MAG: DegT/DnrJ/EryC1/StrS family aminotransferase [Deltaproteobacteria bacterium]|nr:DegT/DnrJ/EryC1/StrS family aminotransferase [Deltaproteobacteria bacterium]
MKPVPIPQLDLTPQYETLQHELAAAMNKVLEEQKFILGPEVGMFERELAEYCDARYAVACASGSDALILALMELGLRPGDAVACPTYTFFATAGAIARLGLRIVFTDVDPSTYNMSLETLERALLSRPKVKAVIPVHLFGQACEPELDDAIRARGAAIVHDAAQAIGAIDARGCKLGCAGLACFSFFPSKNLGCYGDGGALTTGDPKQAEHLRRLRAHGAAQKYFHDEVGMNSRLDTLQAAVLRVKLPHLDAWNTERARAASHYAALFASEGAADSSVPLAAGGLALRIPRPPTEPARHVWNQYVVRVPAAKRDALKEHLGASGIGASIYYPKPLHLQPCFAAHGYQAGELPVSEAAALETLALPIFPELTDAQIERVVSEVVGFLKK